MTYHLFFMQKRCVLLTQTDFELIEDGWGRGDGLRMDGGGVHIEGLELTGHVAVMIVL